MKTYLVLVIILFSLINCQQKENPSLEKSSNQIVIGRVDSVYSDILNESRKIWVHVPRSANSNLFGTTNFPVLYLLDGPTYFHSVSGMIKQLSTANGNMVVPEMVIVAIPNTNRGRDLTPTQADINTMTGNSIKWQSGGGNSFLDFIEKELVPHIEKTYPVTSHKTFVGHSLGGLSVIQALISKPHLFNNYVAIDPSLWWDNQVFLASADSILSLNNYDGKALYVGVANTMMAEGMNIIDVPDDTTTSTLHLRSILQFVNSMGNKKETGLLFDWKYYDNDTHGSVPLIAEYDALRLFFPGTHLMSTRFSIPILI